MLGRSTKKLLELVLASAFTHQIELYTMTRRAALVRFLHEI
jgi:hypothetical protein